MGESGLHPDIVAHYDHGPEEERGVRYALPLAASGYEVHLLDPYRPHVEAASQASGQQCEAPLASCMVGDARACPTVTRAQTRS